MIHRIATITLIALALVWVAHAAQAEANYDNLGRALAQFAFAALAYLAFGITLLVLAIRRNWRLLRRVMLAGALAAIVFPLADTLLLKWQQSRVAAAEIRGQAPDLSANGVLYISQSDHCSRNMCGALMQLRVQAPLWVMPEEVTRVTDFSAPVDLATVPLMLRVADPDGHNTFVLVAPSDADQRPVFTHVVTDRRPYYRHRAGPIETHLGAMPNKTLLGDRLIVGALVAPVEGNRLDLKELFPDYLSLNITRDAFRVPLFPEHTAYGSDYGYEWRRERADWFCGHSPQSDAAYKCRRMLEN